MNEYTLEIKLLSDTTFGMGAGVSGVVDAEIQHDDLGLPILSGRSIKGLLVNQCSEIIFALGEGNPWESVAKRVFGFRGETLGDSDDHFSIGDATIAPDLVKAIHYQNENSPAPLSRQEVLDSLTDIRHQTAMNEYGAPMDESLRANRVLIRGITLYAPLTLNSRTDDFEKALLAACVLSLRRAGLGRNRGKGKIQVVVTDRPLNPTEFSETDQVKDLTQEWFITFKQEVAR